MMKEFLSDFHHTFVKKRLAWYVAVGMGIDIVIILALDPTLIASFFLGLVSALISILVWMYRED